MKFLVKYIGHGQLREHIVEAKCFGTDSHNNVRFYDDCNNPPVYFVPAGRIVSVKCVDDSKSSHYDFG